MRLGDQDLRFIYFFYIIHLLTGKTKTVIYIKKKNTFQHWSSEVMKKKKKKQYIHLQSKYILQFLGRNFQSFFRTRFFFLKKKKQKLTVRRRFFNW